MWASILVAAVVFAADPAPPAQPAQANAQELSVRRLMRQLDSPRLAERQAAEDELTKMGPAALELLPEPTEQMSAEVRQRLDRIRQNLQQQLTEAFAQPTHVTLLGESLPVSQVLAEIQKQTGNVILLGDPDQPLPAEREPKVNVKFDQTPFWQALDDVLGQARLKVYPYAEGNGLQLTFRPENEKPRSSLVSYMGAFRFEVVSALAKRVFRAADGGALDLTLEAGWEPRLAPITLDQPIGAIEAVDENGKPIKVSQDRAQLEVPVVPNTTAVEFEIPFDLPSRDVKRIAKLQGTLSALLPGKIETFRFDKLAAANNVEKRIGSATVVLQQVRKNNDIWEVRIRVRYDESGGAMASHRTWMFNNEAYLESADGEKVPFDTFESISHGEDQFGVAYLFALEKPLDKYVFVYKTPGVILSAKFTYEFSGIELP
jgi:hypothetical protein